MDVQTEQIKDVVIAGIACGDADLSSHIGEHFETMWCLRSGTCRQELAYLYARLDMIALAQDFTRNKVDTAKRSAVGSGRGTFRASNVRDGETQRSSQGTTCSWDEATGYRKWHRDREAHDRASSVAFDQSDGEFSNIGSDRSRTSSSGWGKATTFNESKVDEKGAMVREGFRTSESDSSSGTPNGASSVPYTAPTLLPTLTATQFLFNFNLATLITAALWFAQLTNLAWGEPDPPKGPGVGGSVCDDAAIPGTYGSSGFTDTWQAIPLVGTIRVSAGKGLNVTSSKHRSDNWTDGQDVSFDSFLGNYFNRTYDRSDSYDFSETQKDAHRTGESTRTGQGALNASSSGVDTSHGETNTGSDRSGHSEGQNSSQMSGWTKAHAESEGSDRADSSYTNTQRYWGQIFDALQSMYRQTMQQIKETEGVVAGFMKPVATKVSVPLCTPSSLMKTRSCSGFPTGLTPTKPAW